MHIQSLRRLLLDAKFDVELLLPPSPVSVRELTELEVGEVLPLTQSVEQPAIV